MKGAIIVKYFRLSDDDDVEYDTLLVFERDYNGEKVKKLIKELCKKSRPLVIRDYLNWLDQNGIKVKDAIELNNIESIYIE